MRIALAGFGITGTQVAEHVLEQAELALVSVVVGPHSAKIGLDVGEFIGRKPVGTSIVSSDELAATVSRQRPQVLLDFSHPAFIHNHIETLAKAGVNLVIATTGHSAAELERIKYFTNKYRIGTVMAPNITYGVNALIELCKHAAKLMGGYDFEIVESHHRHKKDSPSGTAKRIAESITNNSLLAADGAGNEIEIHSIRAGGIVGDHKVIICGPYDKIELRHESFSRRVFAQGALWAADFITKHRGFYSMEDIFAYSLPGHHVATCANCNSTVDTHPTWIPSYN
jgi:4-hydroxy-tetrahydrodipicolinate reductase